MLVTCIFCQFVQSLVEKRFTMFNNISNWRQLELLRIADKKKGENKVSNALYYANVLVKILNSANFVTQRESATSGREKVHQ